MNSTTQTPQVTRDGIAGFLLGVGLGTMLGLILRVPDQQSHRKPVTIPHRVEFSPESSSAD